TKPLRKSLMFESELLEYARRRGQLRSPPARALALRARVQRFDLAPYAKQLRMQFALHTHDAIAWQRQAPGLQQLLQLCLRILELTEQLLVGQTALEPSQHSESRRGGLLRQGFSTHQARAQAAQSALVSLREALKQILRGDQAQYRIAQEL